MGVVFRDRVGSFFRYSYSLVLIPVQEVSIGFHVMNIGTSASAQYGSAFNDISLCVEIRDYFFRGVGNNMTSSY